tara:strand:+ start:111 stop:314 length:204 start_codon:yes stop_codon:yes gene_type:complete
MKIFPAIDIKDKKCVRLIKGDFENKTEYKTLPVDQAAIYNRAARIIDMMEEKGIVSKANHVGKREVL